MSEDDPAAEDGPLGPLLPPDDRLWRHPSELSWAPPTTPSAAAAGRSSSGRAADRGPGPRPWALAISSGLTGAVLAVGMVALVGGGLGGGVRERIVERVPVGAALAPPTVRGIPAGVPAVAEAVSPSVVRLDVTVDGGTVSGSGVVFRDDGTVLTNAHVVAGAVAVAVVLADGTAVPARVVGHDRLTDVAVVAVEAEHSDDGTWVPAVLGTASEVRVGQDAIAVGSPLGLAGAPSVTLGVISGLHRRVAADGVVLHDMIQTDAPIARGSSGGALCDGNGVVVGIMTALAAGDDGNADGLAFATPIDVARAVADDLLADGDVERAWLGIEGADGDGGVEVLGVVAEGPAAGSDLAPGDVVVAVGDDPIASMSDLVVALRGHAPGDTVQVEVRRGGEPHAVEVTLGDRP